jgi:hypothetical protein
LNDCLKGKLVVENKNSNWFIDVRSHSRDKPPTPGGFLVIDKVAVGSPADALNLEEADLILSINNKPADSVDLTQLAIQRKPIDYELYQQKSKVLVTIKTNGLLLGVSFSKCSEALVRDIQEDKGDSISAMVTLWQRQDYKHIREACGAGESLFDKLLAFIINDPLDQLMIAICDIEENIDLPKAFEFINKFEEKHNSSYTTDVNSLVYYYRAKEVLNNGDHELFHNYVEYMGSLSPDYQRFRSFVEDTDPKYLASDSPNEGKQFNVNNQLVFLDDNRAPFTLQSVLDEMPKDFLLPICLMSTYRANGPYHDCVKAYHSVYPFIKNYCFPLLVITDDDVGSKNQNYWLSSEKDAKKAGLSLRIAYDEEASFAWDIELSGAPKFITINKEREIVSDKWLGNEYAYWSLVGLAVGVDETERR